MLLLFGASSVQQGERRGGIFSPEVAEGAGNGLFSQSVNRRAPGAGESAGTPFTERSGGGFVSQMRGSGSRLLRLQSCAEVTLFSSERSMEIAGIVTAREPAARKRR